MKLVLLKKIWLIKDIYSTRLVASKVAKSGDFSPTYGVIVYFAQFCEEYRSSLIYGLLFCFQTFPNNSLHE
jgi:hypothetical protein